ncbi:MAG: glutamate racemase [Dehalococcoidia bacterium]|nr:glutamate racemase [Dehalococcoidia bacterium]
MVLRQAGAAVLGYDAGVTDERPIGLFDSGIGGVAVLSEIRRLLPDESLVYFADAANFPYGPKAEDEIKRLAAAATDVLLERGVKLIVVACNTASTMALASLRSRYDVPFVGMVPAVKPASSLSRNGLVGILATEGTVQTSVLADLIRDFANGAVVNTTAAPGLAELVEAGAQDAAIAPVLVGFLDPLIEAGSDVVVLGCTHYFFLRHLIEKSLPAGTQVVDAAEPVARRVRQVLEESGLSASGIGAAGVEYITSGDRPQLLSCLRRWREAGYAIP